MSAEVDDILDKVKRVKNTVNKDGEISQKAVRYMTFAEREAKERDLQEMESYLSPANTLGPQHVVMTADARKNMEGYRKFLKKDLAENVAPPLSAAQRDALYERQKVLEAKIRGDDGTTPPMPPVEVMRRNPVGALGAHQKWEAATKAYQLEYKNIKRAVESDDYTEEVANIEMLRPSMAGPRGEAATFMSDSWTPGYFAQSALSKHNWPLGDPKVDTALAQAERRELEELRAERAARVEEARVAFGSMVIGKPAPKKPAKEPTPWTCHCGEVMTTKQKGVHLAKHARDAKAAEQGE